VLVSDQSALDVFRSYMILPGQMLCFHGPIMDKHRDSLRRLTADGMLRKERFAGGYSLTSSGFAAIKAGDGDR
jgi:hypothetical protein